MKSKLHSSVIAAVVVEILLSFGAIYGGLALIFGPDGSLLGVPQEALAGSPFDTYLLPGIVLLTCFGLAPLVVVIAAFKRARWAHWGHATLGCMLVGFEVIEWAMLGYHVLQAIYIGVGLVLVILGLIAVKTGK